MNAIDLLDMQHGDAEALIERLLEGRAGREARRTLFNRLADALAVHVASEEMHFYPAVNERRTDDILPSSIGEHGAIKSLLRELFACDVGDARFADGCRRLKEEVARHVKEEREQLFPKVRWLFDDDELEAIGQLMTASMVDLERGEPRKLVLGEAAPATSEGEQAGVTMWARLTALPGQAMGLVRSGAQLLRDLRARRTREA